MPKIGARMVRLMWMHLVEPIRWSSPPRGSGGTATSPRVSRAAAVGSRHAIGNDSGRRHVRAGENGVDAGQVARGLRVDRHQAGVSVGRAEHHRVQHPGYAHVLDEPAGAADEPIAAESWMRFADHARDPSIAGAALVLDTR